MISACREAAMWPPRPSPTHEPDEVGGLVGVVRDLGLEGHRLERDPVWLEDIEPQPVPLDDRIDLAGDRLADLVHRSRDRLSSRPSASMPSRCSLQRCASARSRAFVMARPTCPAMASRRSRSASSNCRSEREAMARLPQTCSASRIGTTTADRMPSIATIGLAIFGRPLKSRNRCDSPRSKTGAKTRAAGAGIGSRRCSSPIATRDGRRSRCRPARRPPRGRRRAASHTLDVTIWPIASTSPRPTSALASSPSAVRNRTGSSEWVGAAGAEGATGVDRRVGRLSNIRGAERLGRTGDVGASARPGNG